jgi:putative tricarboxylic transport membrane protein
VRRDSACAALGLALAGTYYAAADALPRSLLADGVGADGVPKLLAAALAVLSVAIGARSLLLAAPAAGDAAPGLARHLRALGVAALGAAFVLLAPVLGYPLALALLVLAAALYYGAAPGRVAVIYAIGAAAALWLIFARGLGIALPAGVFG